MALVHDVKFSTVKEMVLEITDVFLQFSPREPIPEWWEKFKLWVEENDINDVDALAKKLDEVEKLAAKERPAWYKGAEKQFKGATSMKVLTLRTDPFDPEAEGEDDMRASREEPEDDEPEDDEPEDEEPESEDEPSDDEEPEEEEPEDDKDGSE
jgi:hypothetical protein